jgi:acyl-CoA thioesterase FadM
MVAKSRSISGFLKSRAEAFTATHVQGWHRVQRVLCRVLIATGVKGDQVVHRVRHGFPLHRIRRTLALLFPFPLADLQDKRAKLQPVAVRQHAFFHEQLAVDQRAIGAAEVADPDDVGTDAQHAVLQANQLAVEAYMAFGAAAKDEFAISEIQAKSTRLALHDFHRDAHGGILSRFALQRR